MKKRERMSPATLAKILFGQLLDGITGDSEKHLAVVKEVEKLALAERRKIAAWLTRQKDLRGEI